MKTGLYGKYNIQKSNGDNLDERAKYFVLRYDKDKHAKKALLSYADSVEKENKKLANDLRASVL